jgi:two-component system, chemotaxis family, chemotaxis protein CheY
MPDGQSHTPEPRLALVVDDSERVLNDTRELIEPLGFNVITARDAETGLSLAIRRRPAFVLLDLALPGMSGTEFLKTLRGLPGCDRIHVIVCSGNGRPRDIHAAMGAGASEYLLKPFDQDLLAFKLRQVGLIGA